MELSLLPPLRSVGLRPHLEIPNIHLAFVVLEDGRFATLPTSGFAYIPIGFNWSFRRPLLPPGVLDVGSITLIYFRSLSSLVTLTSASTT